MTRRHRVLHVLPDLGHGGGQVVALELVAHADRSRFEVFVARLRPPDDLAACFGELGAPPIRLEHAGQGALIAAIELSRHIRHLNIDLVHVHSDADRKVGQLAALITGVPVVGHLHSPWAHLEPMRTDGVGTAVRWWSNRKARARRAIERRVVEHYVAASEEVAAFHIGRVDAPIAIVNNGVDVTRFSPPTATMRRRARQELGAPYEAAVLVCVGRLAVGKGQDELIRVLPELPTARLVLVGDGAERSSLESLTTSLGVADRVVFAGERADVSGLLAAADLFVFASVSEGLPLSVLEAMASGLPVVAYDLPGLRVVLTEGIEGHLVPLGDRQGLARAILALIEDDRRRATMAKAARDTVAARFDARLMSRGAEAVYSIVLGVDPLGAGRVDADGLVAR